MDVHIREMEAALYRRGHEVLVVGPTGPDGEKRATETFAISTGAIREFLPPSMSEIAELGYNLVAYRRLKAAYAAFKPDLLYERNNLLLLAGMWLSQRSRLPMLLEVNAPLAYERTAHGNLAWRRLARWLEGKVWCSAAAVLPVTHVLADFVRFAGVPDSRIHVIPNGVDLRRFSANADGGAIRQRLGINDSVVLGFTGFMRPWHGLERVIDVIADQGRALGLYLLAVGDGPARQQLEERASEHGIVDRIRFVGAVDRSEIPAYVAAFDIALQPSAVAYACPLKLVEYMAMGKAIVAPDQPNIRELIEDRKTGLLIAPTNTGRLAEAIRLLAKEAGLRRELGCNAAKAVRARGLTWDQNAEKVERLAERIVKSGTR